jgi:hypothetical protein
VGTAEFSMNSGQNHWSSVKFTHRLEDAPLFACHKWGGEAITHACTQLVEYRNVVEDATYMFRFNRFPNTHNQEASAQAKGAGAKEEVSRKRKSAEVEPLRPRTQTEIESNQIGY